jgi:transposase InsO family protein
VRRFPEIREEPKKSDGVLGADRAVKYACIERLRPEHAVRRVCAVLNVGPSGYYAWRCRQPSARTLQDAVLTARVRAIHRRRRRRYGAPRIQRALRDEGVRVARKRVARLMRAAELRARPRRRFPVTTQSQHQAPRAPNTLGRRFAVAAQGGRDGGWAADPTYLLTGEGWLYLAVILDLGSRRVVGWAVSERVATELALGALRRALAQRQPAGGLHHSDQGVQYASAAYRALLAEAGIEVSMSRRGDCWDNAVVESFFATLTKELLEGTPFPTRAVARQEIASFIETWYNRERLHSALGYRSPVACELEVLATL